MSPPETSPHQQGLADACFHCGEPIPSGLDLSVAINGVEQPVCCPGCQAVALTIIDYGLDGFYKYRTQTAIKPEQPSAGDLEGLRIYDDEDYQAGFVEGGIGSGRRAHLILEDIVCPACAWLLESRLARLPGVLRFSVNYASNRARLHWQTDKIRLSEVLAAITALGYRAYPYNPRQSHLLMEQERKGHLRRLGLAGLLGMQVMVIAIALYSGEWSGMEAKFRGFFHWLSLGFTTPVVFYSARPFFQRAWRDLRLLRTGMDVPVALGISIAYLGSIQATVSGSGHVYYDSVVMFVFLLLSARYLEFTTRKHASRHIDNLSRIIPSMATRLHPTDAGYVEEPVAVVQLQAGDRLLVRPGETLPADGIVIEGATTTDESMLTGESLPVPKKIQDALIGGSTNVESPIHMRVTRIGNDTVISNILRLIESGQAGKPAMAEFADRIAAWFVFAVLILAAVVAWYWWHVDREVWLPVTVSLLVITCPCALSLATPVAMTAAATAMMRNGIAVVKQNAIETLARATCMVFDKTGTLTDGILKISKVTCYSEYDADSCLAIAAALERGSEHPIAKAIIKAVEACPANIADAIENRPGAGISGCVQGKRYFLGTRDFIHDQTAVDADRFITDAESSAQFSQVLLAGEDQIHCAIYLSDSPRADAGEMVDALRQRRRSIMILSGDSEQPVKALAARLGVSQAYGRLTPREKLAIIKERMTRGEIVAVIGDGVNDAPVLAGAHVSIAMGGGVDIAKVNADMVLLNNRLAGISQAVSIAARTLTVTRQNMIWALTYNAVAVPAAAMGMIAPWMAAIGMSLSSLVVVGNSIRLNSKAGS